MSNETHRESLRLFGYEKKHDADFTYSRPLRHKIGVAKNGATDYIKAALEMRFR
jgi:hypothetical protein